MAAVSRRTRYCGPRGPSGEARDEIEFAPRGFFNIGRRNVGGRNRTVDLYTRLSLHKQTGNPDDPTDTPSGLGFAEYRVVGTFRQPRAFWSSDMVVTAATEQGVRSSFNFARKGVNADMLRRLSPSIRVSGRYSFSTTRTFDEQLDEEEQATIDRVFPQVRLSTFSGAVARDTPRQRDRAESRQLPECGRNPRRSLSRRAGRLPEDLPAGPLVPAADRAVGPSFSRPAAP